VGVNTSRRSVNDKLLSVKELSLQLGVSPCTVYRWVKEGRIPHIRLQNRGVRFKQSEVDTWLGESKSRPNPKPSDLTGLTRPPVSTMKKSNGETGGTGEMAKAKSKTRLNFGYGALYQRKTRDGRIRWYLDYLDAEGKRIQRVEDGASSSEEAEIALKKAVLAESARVPGAARPRGRIKFTEFSKIFIEDYAMNVKRSWRGDKCRLGILEPYFKDMHLDEITPLMIQKCLAWRLRSRNSKSTANRYLALLKKMFSLAIDEGYLETNPAAKIKKSSEKDLLKERVLTEDEEARLKSASYPVLRSIISVALHTGMRLQEILSLRWAQVNFAEMMLTAERTKSGKPRTIPLNAALHNELLNLRSLDGRSPFVFPNPKTGKPLTTVKTAFGAACRRAGISELRFHDLRHTFGSRLVEKGADIETVRSLLGHASIVVTQRYVHSTDERRRTAVEKLAEKPHLVVPNGANLLHGCDTAEKSSPAGNQEKLVTSGLSVN
jgi:excisionase family DNA binding protein